MRKIFSSESIVEVSHLRNLLETAGIACQIRNDRLSGALGEIPFVECWPELLGDLAVEGRRSADQYDDRSGAGDTEPPKCCGQLGAAADVDRTGLRRAANGASRSPRARV